MADTKAPRYILFRLLLVIGGLLGTMLLVQSVWNYRFVSARLMEEELLREAAQQANILGRHASQMRAREPEEVKRVLEQFLEGQDIIAWVRIRGRDGRVLAIIGEPDGDPLPVGSTLDRDPGTRIHDSRGSGENRVLVTLRPMRLRFRPPGEAGPPPPPIPGAAKGPGPGGGRGQPTHLLEIALYWSSAETAFIGTLRRMLVVQLAAAIALLAAMGFLGLRFRSYVHGKQLEQQLDLARSVQQALLPSGCPACGSLDFAAVCDPAYQVGGDFYDVFTVERDRVALLLGDVSGKGLPAALLMGLLHGAVRSSYWTADGADHEEASRRLNELLCTRTSVERFASMFWCYYDPKQQQLSYVNAGHLAPFVARKNGDGTPRLHRLEEGGPVLGVIPVAEYRQGLVDFQAGDILVLYSDGVVEAANADEVEFGEERLAAILETSHSLPAAEIRDEILRQVRDFVGGEQLQDDLTLMVVRAGREVERSSTDERQEQVPVLSPA
ncbi:MAG: PP2C family protein-serine/threonine phosphatase [bacterium]|nr:PP2C family protein-serine/threonine phosphatase [bacterium]